jgi:hypothetical protein
MGSFDSGGGLGFESLGDDAEGWAMSGVKRVTVGCQCSFKKCNPPASASDPKIKPAIHGARFGAWWWMTLGGPLFRIIFAATSARSCG